MNILVTGGAGFIGSRFTEMLLNESFGTRVDSVVVVDLLTYSGVLENLSDCNQYENFSFERGDIGDRNFISDLIKKNEVTHVVNFAAESHVDRSINDPSPFFTTNVMGTLHLLEASRATGVSTYLQVSTDEVYGSILEGSWEEDHPLKPNSPYAASKASADLLVNSYFRTYGMDVRITRCSNNYGLRQFPEKLIPLFITNILTNQKLPIYGKGDQVREWIHVDDHCRAIFLALTQGEAGHTYNVAGDTELPNIEIAKMIVNHFNKSEDDLFQYVEDRKGHDFRYSMTGKKVQETFGFATKIPLSSGMQQTIDWYIENESWWKPLRQRH